MKRFIALLFLALVVLLFPQVIKADDKFNTSATTTYDINEKRTLVKTIVTIENKTSMYYAQSYSISLTGIIPEKLKVDESGRLLNHTSEEKDGTTTINIAFPDPVVGIGEKRFFSISYEDKSIAVKSGEVWEIVVPKISQTEEFSSYEIRVDAAKSLGNLAYMSPEPINKNEDGTKRTYIFDAATLKDSVVTAAFGEFQVFSFNITYHLENPLKVRSYTEIAIPPDSGYQKVIYENLNPPPQDVTRDSEGNWLAKYYLSARERIDVKATGYVQIYPSSRNKVILSKDEREKYLKPTEVWQKDDPQIKKLAESLKTPKAIYDFVSKTLKYDYERVKPNVERLGAATALKSPNNAICMEYTDLFIAIARAAHIPAREINGYAYTENPDIKPLSLVSDVLHSWPEYYDESKQVWVQIDPTWGSTTGGVDFFNKLDLRHFTFVIHGDDPYKPYSPGSYKLGPNPQKDIYVMYSKLPNLPKSNPNFVPSFSNIMPFTQPTALLTIENKGPIALYNLNVKSSFKDSESKESLSIDYVLPYSKKTLTFNIPYGVIGNKLPSEITFTTPEKVINAKIPKFQVIMVNVSTIMSIVIIVSAVIALSKNTLVKRKING